MATESREYRIAVTTRLQEREQNPQNGIKPAPNAKSHPSFVSAGQRKGTPAHDEMECIVPVQNAGLRIEIGERRRAIFGLPPPFLFEFSVQPPLRSRHHEKRKGAVEMPYDC